MLEMIRLPTIFLLCLRCPSAHLPPVCIKRPITYSRTNISFPDALCSDMGLSLCFLPGEAAGYHQSKVCFGQKILNVGGTLYISLLFSLPGEGNTLERTTEHINSPLAPEMLGIEPFPALSRNKEPGIVHSFWPPARFIS